jgi:histidinol dehydrogenase
MPADGPARQSVRDHGGVIVTRSLAEAIELANAAAPEHMVVDDEATAAQIRCVGSLFVGHWTAQVAGDYAIGSNHVLPTAGAARVRGGLSAADFVRQITVQRVTRAGLSRIGRSVIDLARAEGLNAHAESIAIRLEHATTAKSMTRGRKTRPAGVLSETPRAKTKARPAVK